MWAVTLTVTARSNAVRSFSVRCSMGRAAGGAATDHRTRGASAIAWFRAAHSCRFTLRHHAAVLYYKDF